MDLSWLLPPSVSSFGPRIDHIYYVILVITGAIFVFTEGMLVWAVVRYRHKEGRRAHYSHGNSRLEIAWTLIPFVIVLLIAWASAGVWLDAKEASRFPSRPDDLHLLVTAKQFEWNVTYPGADGKLGTDDDFVKRNQLHVPVGRDVRIDLRSEDVIHSFFLPDFRVKQDAVPGMDIQVWFQPTKVGEYTLQCAELCGLGHYRMRASVTVHEDADFDAWMRSQGAAAAKSDSTQGGRA